MHYGGKAWSKGKGKQEVQGQGNNCGEWGHKAVQCQKRLTCWACGDLGDRLAECPEGKGKGKNGGKAQFEQKGSWTRVSTRAGASKMIRATARALVVKERDCTAKVATYAVLEEQDWIQWNGCTEGEGDGALALFNFTDSSAGKEPTALSRSSEPMREDFRDFIKSKKVVTSKLNTKKEKAKMQEQNRFEILGCLLEDSEVIDEEPKDVSVVRRTSPGTTSSATSRIPIVSRHVKTNKSGTLNFCA